jgi:DNA-binding winged helix-turn-helix (wHTH) protein/predicted ATPase
MLSDHEVRFGRHRFEPRSGRLWLGSREIRLTPKAAAVLALLIERAGQVVTRDELFAVVWNDAAVSDTTLTSCVRELRQALGDDAARPRFIETRHRRGYRFLAHPSPSDVSEAARASPSPAAVAPPLRPVVGREDVLAQLRACLERARHGERQLVFVTGEPGIGKTTVVDTFLGRVGGLERLRVGQGRCIEHYGPGEPYLPVLEALTRLCREAGEPPLLPLLRQHAPTWLAQMPSLLTPTELRRVERIVSGATRVRMLRELAEALEAITSQAPLVLWLEDVHWSDASTLDGLGYLARRPGPARLLVIGTYRTGEVLANDHPLQRLKEDLELHERCRELALGYLTEAEVSDYVTARLDGARSAPELGRVVHQRTDGHPLFMVHVTDDLLARRGVESPGGPSERAGMDEVLRGLPASVRRFVHHALERLSATDQRILEAASLVGSEFSATAVSAALARPVPEVEERCSTMARQEQFLNVAGGAAWPDGTVSARYAFRHALHQEVLSQRISEGARLEQHRRIARRLERGFGQDAPAIASELAMHFERGAEPDSAVRYLRHAGETALRRSAHAEAIAHLTRAIDLLQTLADGPARTRQEIMLRLALGPAWMAARGYAAPEVEQTYARALELSRGLGEPLELFRAIKGLWNFRLVRAELRAARALSEELLDRAERRGDGEVVTHAHAELGQTLFHLGELREACEHLERAIVREAPASGAPDARVLAYLAWALWCQGYPDQALARGQEAAALARANGRPHHLAFVLGFVAWLYELRREFDRVDEVAAELSALCRAQGYPYWLTWGTMLHGWVQVQRGKGESGVALLREGLDRYRETGAEVGLVHFLTPLAAAYARVGRPADGLAVLDEALTLARTNGNCYMEAELHRLRGDLTLMAADDRAAAEACYLEAFGVARRQGARSFELRTAMSLARLRAAEGRAGIGRADLTAALERFTEGFETGDLREGRALLTTLASGAT